MRWTALPQNTAWVAQADTLRGAGVDDRARPLRQRAGGVDDVVDDHGALALHVTDDVHDLGDVRRRAALVDDREARAEALGERARALDAAGIRRHDDGRSPPKPERAQLLDEDRHRVQVIERDVEEALDLAGVQVDREDAVGAGGRDQVRDELGGDRRARLGLAILPRVAEVRDDRDDASRPTRA